MTETPHIISIQAGKMVEYPADEHGEAWSSSIVKTAVEGAVWLGATNITGDAQTDLKNHGGEDKAVLAYSVAHYDYWRDDLPGLDWAHGAFGENLTIEGLDEETVCIGDVYAIGVARVQVSQPRQPCWKLSRRWKQKDLTARVHDTGFTGWYLRVLAEGEIEAEMDVKLIERRHPDWTVMRATRVMQDKSRVDEARELAALPELAVSWRRSLAKRLE